MIKMINWYHGSQKPSVHYCANAGQSDYPDMLFFSQSANVARRYGSQIHQLSLDTSLLRVISLAEGFGGILPDSSFIIAGDLGYDFPVPTLVLRQKPTQKIENIDFNNLPDDGLAFRHEPKNELDRQFQAYINEHCDGNVDVWREYY